MGGRGASSGASKSGRIYGTEYKTLAQFGSVKVVRLNGKGAVTAPMETVTRGRVYATVDGKGDIKHISFYDEYGERTKQIDVKGKPHNGLLPHVHVGYEHNEISDRDLTEKERSVVNDILKKMEQQKKTLEYLTALCYNNGGREIVQIGEQLYADSGATPETRPKALCSNARRFFYA